MTDARATGELDPLPVFPLVEYERLNALAKPQVLAQPHNVERHRSSEVKNPLRRNHLRGLRSLREVLPEGRVHEPAEGPQRFHIVFMNQTAAVRRQVQKEHGAAADGREVQVKQVLGRTDLAVLLGMVEPAGTD